MMTAGTVDPQSGGGYRLGPCCAEWACRAAAARSANDDLQGPPRRRRTRPDGGRLPSIKVRTSGRLGKSLWPERVGKPRRAVAAPPWALSARCAGTAIPKLMVGAVRLLPEIPRRYRPIQVGMSKLIPVAPQAPVATYAASASAIDAFSSPLQRLPEHSLAFQLSN